MAEVKHFPQAGLYATRENVARKVAPAEHPGLGAELFCVYNQTRQRFVATGVEVWDASRGDAAAGLPGLEPAPGAGLWILPCPEISPTSIRFPLDLVYLGSDRVVLEVVKSFPLAGPSAAIAGAAGSVLVLPENTVTRAEIRTGDHLILSAPGEMKLHLENLKEAKAEGQDPPASFLELYSKHFQEPAGASADSPLKEAAAPLRPEATGAVVQRTEIAGIELPVTPPEPATRIAMPAYSPQLDSPPGLPQAAPAPWKKNADPGNWLERLFRKEPADPRSASRESLPGLIAYFFTGGAPVGHAVRDISAGGMFVITEERWYPGTTVQITLADRHNPTTERSIIVNARAIRWGSDGVGVEFVLSGNRSRNGSAAEATDPAQIEEFLRVYKGLPPQP